MSSTDNLAWHKVLDLPGLEEGRVTTVTAGTTSIALSRFEGKYGAIDNRCPHQGGPLGEGSIEKGAEGKCWLRCPWHGWDYDPITGTSPGGYGDGLTTFQVEEREDGIYVAVPEEEPHIRTNSDVMAETLANWGVRHIFGMVGHSNLGMADALRLQEEAGQMQFYGIRHEGAAAFACSAYGKLTGRVAACFTIAGPGATNLMTGLYDAKVDRAPMLALSGQVDTQVLGPGAFQEVDLQGAFKDVSFFNHTVYADSKYGELVSLALKNALLQRGPVTLVLPNEVQELPAAEGAEPGTWEGRVTAQNVAPPQQQLDDAIAKVREAKRPMIVVGHGARFHMGPIIKFAEKLHIPVVTTFKGKGLISDSHPLGCGVLGRSGTPIASWFMNESDQLIVIGASFSNHTGISSYKSTIQIDFDPMALGKFHAVDNLVYGEIGRTMELLNQAFPKDVSRDGIEVEVAERWRIWREEKTSRLTDDDGNGVNSSSVFDSMNRIVQDNSILTVDVGNNAYSFGRYFESSGNQAVLMSGYLGSIGFGYPAAIGAWAATTEEGPFHQRPVWCVTGDGGFGQYMMELLTAVKYKMNITHVLLHNSELGKITKEQRAGEFEVWKTSLHNPNFAEYAELCGAKGIRVEKREDLDAALTEARDYCGPSLVEVMTDAKLV